MMQHSSQPIDGGDAVGDDCYGGDGGDGRVDDRDRKRRYTLFSILEFPGYQCVDLKYQLLKYLFASFLLK